MDLTRIQYPCFLHKKIEGTKLIYIHDTLYYKEVGEKLKPPSSVFEGLERLRNYVLEMVYDEQKNRIYIYDGMTVDEWATKNCKLDYEDRLGLVRHCVNIIADHKNIIDMPLDICNNPGDVLNYQERYEEEGYDDFVIKNMHDKYRF